MSPSGIHAHAAALMRSLLFVPANDAKKLDKAMACGADALIVDLEDSIPAQGKANARTSAAAFVSEAGKAAHRPRLLVRINGFATGLADADLDAVVPARPDAIMLPKAEGGADVVRTDAKLLAREAIAGLPDGSAWARDELEGDPGDPATLGREVADRPLGAGAGDLLAAAEAAV